MREHNIFEAIYLSFFSPQLYRDVANNWGGKAFIYLFMIISLSWIIFTVQTQRALNIVYFTNLDKIITQAPVMIIKNGVINTPENHPYFVRSVDGSRLFAIIDTSGKYTTLPNAQSMMLVTQTSIITQDESNKHTKIRERTLPSTLNVVINPTKINNIISQFIPFAWIVLFSVFVMLGFIYRLIQAVIYALIGKIVNLMMGSRLFYTQILPIAMVAITPALVLSTLFGYIHFKIPHQSLFFFGITLFYLFFGMIAVTK